MWQLINQTGFAAERCFARDADGREVWIVAVKGTFDIDGDGRASLASVQEPVFRTPVYFGDPETSPLERDGELQLTKSGTDVTLHGCAHVPGGRFVETLDVTMEIASLKKTLRVTGDRVFQKGLFRSTLTSPMPFNRMPLGYERAFGGVDAEAAEAAQKDVRNPAGLGYSAAPWVRDGTKAPNIGLPRGLSGVLDSEPAGFGPVAGHWQPRAALAGTYDAAWQKERAPLLPRDFDAGFHRSAPRDQQLPTFLRGGEACVLTNLTRVGVLRFLLPAVRLGFQTRVRSQVISHEPALHSVMMEPEVSRVLLLWQTSVPCDGHEDQLRHTVIFEKGHWERGGEGQTRNG